jgi:tellurite resistance protein TehA-like permease
MGTGILSALINNFPYGNGSPILQWFAFAFFMLNLALFVFVCICTALRYMMFPQVNISLTSDLPISHTTTGVGTHAQSPCSKPVLWLFSDGYDYFD